MAKMSRMTRARQGGKGYGQPADTISSYATKASSGD